MRRIFLALLLVFILPLANAAKEQKITLDFIDTALKDVVRSISLAYDIPILIEDGSDIKVTFHLSDVGLLEGLAALCESHGLEFFQEGNVYYIRYKRTKGEFHFSKSNLGVSVFLKDKDIQEFIREYAANTGINIVASPSLKGKISGVLQNLPAEDAFFALIESAGFRIRKQKAHLEVDTLVSFSSSQKENSLFKIERNDSLYSILVEGVSLREILQALSNESQINLALYGDVQEKVWMKLSNVTLNNLLFILFRGSRYVYELDSNNLYIAEKGGKNALGYTRLYVLKYIDAEKALKYLIKMMPDNNVISSEVKEQNAILICGSLAEIKSAENILSQIDVKQTQVTLACVIVEFRRGSNFELGLRGGTARKTGEGNIGVKGFFDFLGKDVSKTGAFGKIGILPDRFEIELASLEEKNIAEVLARPKLTTLNGNKAELNVTNTVYYMVSQVTADGYPITDYRSFNDGISLELTPSVTREGLITLEISPEIKTAGRSNGDGPRDISTRNLKTTVVLKNGETICLGGLVRKTKSEIKTAIPFLGSLPFVGRFFSYVSEEDEENELAIFITPEVLF